MENVSSDARRHSIRRLLDECNLWCIISLPQGLFVNAGVIADRAAAVIFAHNHPSGDLRPSDNDLRIHNQLTEAGKILGLRVLDHIIVSKKNYYSFQEAGLIA